MRFAAARRQVAAHTFPYIDVRNASGQVEHEASTSRIGEDQIFYCRQRGLSEEDAVSMIVNGFCKQVFKELPMEFAVEAQKLLGRDARRSGGLMGTKDLLLEIRDLHAEVAGKEILKGPQPRAAARARCTP